MANAILGRKLTMSQLFEEDGKIVPVTVIEAGPCPVLQVKTEETSDGYRALQIGFDWQKAHRVTKPLLGHFKKAGTDPTRIIREISYSADQSYSPGDEITTEIFAPGDKVDVIGISKGKGFQGTIRRHNFSRGPKTHGSKNYREQGSTGMHTYPGRVLKGKPMPGHQGDRRVTVQNLVVVRVDATNNLLYVRGAVPGANNGIIEIRRARKAGAKS